MALSILLWTLPVLAEVPCAGSSCPAKHCASCCHETGMNDSAMNAAMALTLTPMESSASQCNCVAAREVSAPVKVQEEQELAALVASPADFALLLPGPAQFAPEGYRTPPLLAFSSRSQSILCTFQI